MVVFWLSAFILPKCCLRKIDAICAHYLWSGDPEKTNGAKISWSTVCLPKKEGGLGIRRFEEWNKALSLRLIWSLFQKRRNPWVYWHYTHNIRNKSFWNLNESQGQSWSWRTLLRLRPLARRFIRGKVGNGKIISFWHDHWTPMGPLIDVLGREAPRNLGIEIEAKVVDACSSQGWRIPGARSEAEVLLQAFLTSIPMPTLEAAEDEYQWFTNGVSSPAFDSKKTWAGLRLHRSEQQWTKHVWFKGAIPAHAFLLWVTQWDRLPTRARTSAWSNNNNNTTSLCILCNASDETRDHLFFTCSYAKEVWSMILRRLQQRNITLSSWSGMLHWLDSLRFKDIAILGKLAAQASIYQLWRQRNNVIHNDVRLNPQVTFKIIDKDVRNSISGRRSRRRWKSLMELWFKAL